MEASSGGPRSYLDRDCLGGQRAKQIFIGSVVAETVAANSGIGYLMMVASGRFDVPLVFAALVVVGVMGVGMYQAFVIIERRMTFWAIRTQEVVT